MTAINYCQASDKRHHRPQTTLTLPFMDFALPDEHRMLKDLVARFVREELLPLEKSVLDREASGLGLSLTPDERAPLDKQSRALGLWGLDAPEDVGGSDLPLTTFSLVCLCIPSLSRSLSVPDKPTGRCGNSANASHSRIS